MSQPVKWYRTKKFKALVVTILGGVLAYYAIDVPEGTLTAIVEALSAIGA